MSKKTLITLIFVFSSLSSVSHSIELEASSYADFVYTSNARKEAASTHEDLFQTIGLDASIKEERRRFNIDVSFNLEEERYANHTYSDQTSLTAGLGIFNFDLIDEFLNWESSFTRIEVLKTKFDNNLDTPDNREERDIVVTGPVIRYRVNRASDVSLHADYINTENSDPDSLDTERYVTGADYIYKLNASTVMSVALDYDEVIDADGAEELRNVNYRVRAEREFSRGAVEIGVGRTRSWSDEASPVRGMFYDFSLSREEVYGHDIEIEYTEDLSDSSIGFDVGSDKLKEVLPDAGEAGAFLDVVRRKAVTVSFDRELERFKYELLGFWNYDEYTLYDSDLKSRGGSVSVISPISAYWEVGLKYEFELADSVERQDIRKDVTRKYQINSSYQFIEEFDVRAYLQFEERSNVTAPLREYEEFSLGVRFTWGLLN